MKIQKLLFFIFLTVLLCFAGPAFAGLGISPSDWVEKNGLLGQQIEKTFTLSRSNAEEDLYFTSKITGEIANWIEIENGNSFIMPKGEQQLPVNVILSIPQNAEQKEYKGEIRLNSESRGGEVSAGSVGVLLSALIRIDLTVSDKPFLSYDVLQIEIPTQETGDFINVILKIWNKGNVEAKPTKLTADIFDKFNTTKIDSFILTDFSAITGVAPFSEGEIKLQIPIQLTPEQYWADISVYQDEKVLKSDDVTFDIVEAGALKKEAVAVPQNFLLIIGGILLAVAIIAGIVIGIWFFIKNKIFILILIATSLIAGNALASATINSVKVNGADSIAVGAGEPITATVSASLTNSSAWRSTAYRFGEGSWNCVDTKDHDGGTTATETFLITAPVRAGTNDVSFEIYTNNDCTNGLGITVLSASLLTTFINIFSFGTGKIWLSIALLALIIIALAFAIFYIIKIIIGKKTKINSEDK